MDFGIRVGAVVRRDDAFLLVRHEKPGEAPYWVLPGGRLEPGETIPQCAERELSEETGLRGTFRDILFVGEFLREGRHTVDVFARVDAEGEATLGSDPEVEPGTQPTLREVRWVSLADLPDLDLLPSSIKMRLLYDADRPAEIYLEDDGR
jgi:ADP-ribose pyrophosphatase YjhB (NUDIX family)